VDILLGLVGWPLQHTLSPAIHHAALRNLGLAGEYRLCPIPPLPAGEAAFAALLSAMRRGEWRGLNLTIPHKRSAIPFLDELTPLALSVGAINTVFLHGKRLIGDNTDVPGFRADLVSFLSPGTNRQREYPGEDKALILGAGGAARAAAFALAGDGWRVSIAARRLSQAQQLKEDLQNHYPGRINDFLAAEMRSQSIQATLPCGLIVNATPLGMAPDIGANPWPPGLPFPPEAAVYDLVYFPKQTALVRSAREAGLRAVTGLGMLIEQAALAFERWFDFAAPRQVMRAAAEFALDRADLKIGRN
jgi:shikimate dehydrogenase